MVQKKKIQIDKPLTEVELEMMNVIWELGECTVKDVQTRLSQDRDLAYTSVATIMKILEQKGVLKSEKADRAHTYKPLILRTEYEASSLKHLADNLFHGDPSSMVVRLLNESKLSKEELQSIQKILDERIGK
ncbi:MAG: BlaI/MecI/CopY family transcriptional regulator [Bacteriovoracia bacterium]